MKTELDMCECGHQRKHHGIPQLTNQTCYKQVTKRKRAEVFQCICRGFRSSLLSDCDEKVK